MAQLAPPPAENDTLGFLETVLARCSAGDPDGAWQVRADMLVQRDAAALVRRRLIPALREKAAWEPLAHVLGEYLRAAPGTPADRLLLSATLVRISRPDEAREVLDLMAAEDPGNVAVAAARLQLELKAGRIEVAAQVADAFPCWNAITARAAHLGMLALLRAHQPRRALELFTACREDTTAELTAAAVDAHVALGEAAAANRLARRAIEAGQGSAALYYRLGTAAAAAFEYDRAITHFVDGLECAPGDVRTLAALGEVMLTKGRPAAALVHLRRALKLAPDLVHVRALHARGLKAARDYDGAAREWYDIVARQPDNAKWKREAASVLNLAGRHGEARQLFGRLIEQRAQALPDQFEAGLERLWDKLDEARIPEARLQWAWGLRDPAQDIAYDEWVRRARWGYLADRLIFDWLECSPERAEEAMQRLAELDEDSRRLAAEAGTNGGLVLVTAHIGPMFASPLALQLVDFTSVWLASSPSMPGMAYTDSLISTSDQTEAQIVRLAMRALDSGKAVGLAVDGAVNMAAPRIVFEGQEITYSSFAARLAHKRRAPSFFVMPQWREGRLGFHLGRLPSPETGETIEDFGERWKQGYLAELRTLLAGEPENLRLSGGIWRHIRTPE